MYIGNNVRPKLDKEIEALAQAINRNSRVGNSEYSLEGITSYSFARLLSRLTQMQGGITLPLLTGVLGTLETVKQEFARKATSAYLDRQRNLNGEVFSELL